jgi:hypothetical protein
MTLPSSGPISLQTIANEINTSTPGTYAAGAKISLNDAAVRNLAGVASGPISLSNFYGKSSNFVYNGVISASTNTPFNLSSALTAAGWNGTQPVVATLTVNSGVTLGSNSTGTAALTGCALPSGSSFSITNNGTVVGCCGSGGAGGAGGGGSGGAGGSGGPAIGLGMNTTIINNGTIGGGGGGGGGGAEGWYDNQSNDCCLIAGTLVSTPLGERRIETIEVGETIYAHSLETHLDCVVVVTDLVQPLRAGYYNITTSDGVVTGATNDHPFYDPVAQAWTSIDPDASASSYPDLTVVPLVIGSAIQTQGGESVKVIAVEYIEGAIRTYTLRVNGPHTFFANGLLTHNNCITTHSYTYYSGGNGGAGAGYGSATSGSAGQSGNGAYGGNGGNGGALGSAGSSASSNLCVAGGSGSGSGNGGYSAGPGGSPGNAVVLNSYTVTWGGTNGNSSSYVKGAVS